MSLPEKLVWTFSHLYDSTYLLYVQANATYRHKTKEISVQFASNRMYNCSSQTVSWRQAIVGEPGIWLPRMFTVTLCYKTVDISVINGDFWFIEVVKE